MSDKKLNGFNNGRDTTEGVGGKKWLTIQEALLEAECYRWMATGSYIEWVNKKREEDERSKEISTE